MILIHSKRTNPSEIQSFSRAWTGAVPLVIVPNAYPDIESARDKTLGNISMMIFGNYGIRAAANACRRPPDGSSLTAASRTSTKDILPVNEIFRIQNMHEVKGG